MSAVCVYLGPEFVKVLRIGEVRLGLDLFEDHNWQLLELVFISVYFHFPLDHWKRSFGRLRTFVVRFSMSQQTYCTPLVELWNDSGSATECLVCWIASCATKRKRRRDCKRSTLVGSKGSLSTLSPRAGLSISSPNTHHWEHILFQKTTCTATLRPENTQGPRFRCFLLKHEFGTMPSWTTR